jgi:hypothetical protein
MFRRKTRIFSTRTNACSFIYGGERPGSLINDYTPDKTQNLDKVYILTLPAFQWIEAPANGTTRCLHSCQIIGQRQMLSIAGTPPIQNFQFQDPWENGLGIFDMTELTWGFNYNASAAPYTPSLLVSEYYNTSSRYPSFSDAALATIFNSTAVETTSSPTSSHSTSPTSPTGTNLPAPKPSHTRAIVGGVVGGVAIVALVAGIWFLCWRWRHRKQRYDAAYTESQPEPDSSMVPELDTQKGVFKLDNTPSPVKPVATYADTPMASELENQNGVSELDNKPSPVKPVATYTTSPMASELE